jgi:hypothetical protein
MLTQKEADFIVHWEQVREKQSTFASKLLRGLPMAMLLWLPILFLVPGIYVLSPDWYTKIAKDINSGTITILIAVLLSVVFYAYVRMHFKWEMNEQLYQELKGKQKADAAN